MKSFDELKALIEQRGVHAVFGASGEGWAIEQNADELAQFLVVCQEQGVQSVLEIGTGYRAGLARFLHDDMGWQVTSVDIHDYGHQFGGIQFVKSDGVELPVFTEKFDLVIIDADHSYEGVKFDHDYYGKYADKIVMFHDIAGLRDCEGAGEYWKEIAYVNGNPQIGYHDIIAEGDQRGGIGYIVLSEVQAQLEQEIREGLEDVKAGRMQEIKHTSDLLKGDNVAPKKRTPAKKPATSRKTAAKK